MKYFNARILLLPGLFLVIAVLLFLGVQLHTAYSWLYKPMSIEKEFLLELETGATFATVGDKISRHVGDMSTLQFRLWVVHARYTGLDTAIKAGEFMIVPGMTPEQISRHLASGQVVKYSFRIQEGWTVDQLRSSLSSIKNMVSETAGWSDMKLVAWLQIDAPTTEGQFFPDTYQYVRGDSDLSILIRAYKKMQFVISREWPERAENLPLRSKFDALTLASIIEKETGKDSERAHISQVFNNRLKRNMRLQTDPTIIYGLGKSFDGNLTRKHLDTDGEYNTYMRRGLPPSPIALPGLASIRAALHPSAGKLLYFVGKGDGSSQFSDNLDDHLTAVRRYQLEKQTQ